MKKCYSKRLEYIVPTLKCDFCSKHIKCGESLYRVILEWGSSKTACEDCYNEYEVDWSMHDDGRGWQ